MGRIERVNSELKKQIAFIIDREIKDPRVHTGMITVTKVTTTPDLKYAKVYLSFLSDDAPQRDEAFKAIVNAAAYIRNALKNKLDIRLIPELNFAVDTSAAYGANIDRLLRELNLDSTSTQDTNDGEDDK